MVNTDRIPRLQYGLYVNYKYGDTDIWSMSISSASM